MTDGPVARGLLDRRAIEDVVLRYGSAIDAGDHDGLRSVFADDAVGRYADQDPIVGGDAIVAWIEEMVVGRTWQHHLLSLHAVELDGDGARALTYLHSTQLGGREAGAAALNIGRYRDALRRIDGRWQITEKVLEIGWSDVRPGLDRT